MTQAKLQNKLNPTLTELVGSGVAQLYRKLVDLTEGSRPKSPARSTTMAILPCLLMIG